MATTTTTTESCQSEFHRGFAGNGGVAVFYLGSSVHRSLRDEIGSSCQGLWWDRSADLLIVSMRIVVLLIMNSRHDGTLLIDAVWKFKSTESSNSRKVPVLLKDTPKNHDPSRNWKE